MKIKKKNYLFYIYLSCILNIILLCRSTHTHVYVCTYFPGLRYYDAANYDNRWNDTREQQLAKNGGRDRHSHGNGGKLKLKEKNNIFYK